VTPETADGLTGKGRRIKAAIVIPALSGGGAEFVALQWADYLHSAGHDITVITTHDPQGTLDDLPVVALTATSFLARGLELRAHVAEYRYDVLLGMMPHWNLLVLFAALGRSAGRPAVLISGRNVEAPMRPIQPWTYRAELLLCHLLYRRADGYVAISHPVAAEAAAEYRLDPERIWVVPNPATSKLVNRQPHPLRDCSAGLADTVTLTVPARLVRQKRPELAVETAAVLRSRHRLAASVEFFGQGPDEALVREAATRLGVPVSFRGWVTTWFDEAAPDAVVLLPSVAEGFANVLVEAAAAGIPSVASSRALGVADAVVPNVTGVLTMGSEPTEFAAAVLQARRLAPVSAPEWLLRFSPEESGLKLVQVLQSVTASRCTEGSRPMPNQGSPLDERPPVETSA
jgi:glycosyltransferase involved in cell wall biosynthesis